MDAEVNRYRKITHYCMYRQKDGTPYPTQKATSFWTNIPFETCKCAVTKFTSCIGDKSGLGGGNSYFGQGKTILLYIRHSIVEELVEAILLAAIKVNPAGRFVLDCFFWSPEFEGCV